MSVEFGMQVVAMIGTSLLLFWLTHPTRENNDLLQQDSAHVWNTSTLTSSVAGTAPTTAATATAASPGLPSSSSYGALRGMQRYSSYHRKRMYAFHSRTLSSSLSSSVMQPSSPSRTAASAPTRQ